MMMSTKYKCTSRRSAHASWANKFRPHDTTTSLDLRRQRGHTLWRSSFSCISPSIRQKSRPQHDKITAPVHWSWCKIVGEMLTSWLSSYRKIEILTGCVRRYDITSTCYQRKVPRQAQQEYSSAMILWYDVILSCIRWCYDTEETIIRWYYSATDKSSTAYGTVVRYHSFIR